MSSISRQRRSPVDVLCGCGFISLTLTGVAGSGMPVVKYDVVFIGQNGPVRLPGAIKKVSHSSFPCTRDDIGNNFKGWMGLRPSSLRALFFAHRKRDYFTGKRSCFAVPTARLLSHSLEGSTTSYTSAVFNVSVSLRRPSGPRSEQSLVAYVPIFRPCRCKLSFVCVKDAAE